MGKEEIARYERFILFPQCFQKMSVVDVLKCLWSKGLSSSFSVHCFVSRLLDSYSNVGEVEKY